MALLLLLYYKGRYQTLLRNINNIISGRRPIKTKKSYCKDRKNYGAAHVGALLGFICLNAKIFNKPHPQASVEIFLKIDSI